MSLDWISMMIKTMGSRIKKSTTGSCNKQKKSWLRDFQNALLKYQSSMVQVQNFVG